MESNHKNRIWITWETQRRNPGLAEAFGCTYLRLEYSKMHPVVRYARSVLETTKSIMKGNYHEVFVQCPSIVLCWLALTLRPFYGYRLIIDAHNIAVEKAESSRGIYSVVYRSALRFADFVIVTNSILAKRILEWGVKPLVLPDRLPAMQTNSRRDFRINLSKIEGATRVVTFISTFAEDEPILEFLDAWRDLAPPAVLYITGRRARAGELLKYESESIQFTDFLPEEDYVALISQSDLVVDLTTRSDCLVCGAYEALALDKVALVSDSLVNREIFPEFLHSKATKGEIRASLENFFRYDITTLNAAKRNFENQWKERFRLLERTLSVR